MGFPPELIGVEESGQELPYWREMRKLEPGMRPRIEVAADAMRVGKTTAVQVLEQGLHGLGLPVKAWYEDWQNNPFLELSYSDPGKYLFDSQVWFLMTKHSQLRERNGNMHGFTVQIQDLPPEGDWAYVKTNSDLGRMSADNYCLYCNLFKALPWDKIPAPDLLIHLTASEKTLLNRAKWSARNFEKAEQDYLLTMQRVNREWVAGAGVHGWRVLTVDTDRLNFAENGDHKAELVQVVLDNLQSLGWSMAADKKETDDCGI
jgi:deoxyadenosine/deoxycytidine kinase